ncbi:phage tail family protein [Cytobacillus oceanisediminis]|jgi:predicted phage tail component-like protein|uniref:distal tail protein Dit n=1 Tax=Cytobacillus TaxID=2675230 RepID=UPI001864805C|nr:distal tail protein Dit [Cytobacillus oceanisediminis]MCM3241590.1 phage tail family protein [Cytobacillus oceanisediminis]MCM3528266.1 phage tail family protein [Cytobacillus oceanisediminis]MCS0823135.1 phage tail family protein [Cytobacillus firmus]QOK27679.1 phage tail family protein [Cytobacillus oceanisediminis]
MAWGFTYNGIHSTEKGLRIANIAGRDTLPDIESRTAQTTSKHGVHYFGYRFQERRIRVEIALYGSSLPNFRSKIRDLAAWLNPNNGPSELIFDDEPDKKYYSVVTENTDFEGIFAKRVAEIEFLCPDPFAYSITESSATISNGSATIKNTGTAEAFPIITVDFSASATEIKIEKNSNEFIRIVRNFVAGDEVVIDCQVGTITYNGTTSLITALDIYSDFFSLDPGDTTLTFTPAGVSAVSLVYVRRWL